MNDKVNDKVEVRVEDRVIPTYLPAPPDKNPMFLEKRVYQGSSGKVYPLPFTDRIAEKPVDRKWKAVWIENEFLRVLVLPELGGRIHALQDKTNGYDLIYNQPVIKPALVGLAGPWVSGGIEFNWPQHHRPATFLPVDFEIENHADGAKTIWCSDHDPMARMKGMHGVCLRPGRAWLELKVRVYNRTPFVQTFLWWANVATRVHEAYQSFFPPDVYYVADHARRSMSEYPLCRGFYYGVNYGERGRKGVPLAERPTQFVPPHCAPNPQPSTINYQPNDFSFYANIPVPTSYMCMDSRENFVGGYDYRKEAGIVHYANHHISPGKKQWTWGNHEFGYAWDRNLTDADARGEFGPYIELMAGVYTDNQPDFSFLQPGETKSWSQYWYPIQKIGPARHANLDAAISLNVLGGGGKRSAKRLFVGVSVTRQLSNVEIVLAARGKRLISTTRSLAPGKPFVAEIELPRGIVERDLQLRVADSGGREVISYQPKPRTKGKVPPPASEPPALADIASVDDLFLTGLHLEQYRHATRCPTLYWREALGRDPFDARCNNALGLWHLKRGEFVVAENHFRNAIERLTRRNANPYDGEPFYNLGLCLRWLERDTEAYDAFYKATWNRAWASAGYHALAEIDCTRHAWPAALDHLSRSLQFDTDNLRARNLKVMALRKLGETRQTAALLHDTLRLDRLDWWARHLNGEPLTCDLQTRLDIAHDLARAGFFSEAIELLGEAVAPKARKRFSRGEAETRASDSQALPNQSWGALPLVEYTLGWLHQQRFIRSENQPCKPLSQVQQKFVASARRHFRAASALSSDYCFPSRLEDIAVLEAAMCANPRDARAPYYLGNLLYDRRRHEEAIRLWERSAKLNENFSVVWRNLGIGYFNIRKQPARARAAYDRAFKANPGDARLLYERDQLWKRLGEKPPKRLRELEKRLDLVQQRDDLSVELCALYNQTGQPAKALSLVSSRKFQPWEGGEGGPLGQWVRSHLALGHKALAQARQFRTLCRKLNRKLCRHRQSSIVIRHSSRLLTLAVRHFEAALTAPHKLGEAKHLLANQSDIHYWLGCAHAAVGDRKAARRHWSSAANFKGDFQEMSVRSFSELTYYSACAWQQLGQRAKARKLLRELLAYARNLQKMEAKIDYFATSLPAMLLFEDDLQFRQETTALFLQAQAHCGLGNIARGRTLLTRVLRRDPSHERAADLLRELETGDGEQRQKNTKKGDLLLDGGYRQRSPV